jgi:hypothetical protein
MKLYWGTCLKTWVKHCLAVYIHEFVMISNSPFSRDLIRKLVACIYVKVVSSFIGLGFFTLARHFSSSFYFFGLYCASHKKVLVWHNALCIWEYMLPDVILSKTVVCASWCDIIKGSWELEQRVGETVFSSWSLSISSYTDSSMYNDHYIYFFPPFHLRTNGCLCPTIELTEYYMLTGGVVSSTMPSAIQASRFPHRVL